MANSDYKGDGGGDFAPIAELNSSLDYLGEVMTIKHMITPNPDILKQKMVALIDEEFVEVVGEATGSTVNIRRGIYDTIPAPHTADSEVWFVTLDQRDIGTDAAVHAGGDEIAVKVLPWTVGGGTMPIEASTPNDLKMNWRFFRPYPPGKLLVSSLPWFNHQVLSADNPTLPLEWNHRDRVLQADKLVAHPDADVGPEPGTTYTARIKDMNDNLKREEVGLTGKNWAYTWTQAMSDFGLTSTPDGENLVPAKMEFCSHRDGFDSWQSYVISFDIMTQAEFLRVAQLAGFAVQPTDVDPDAPPEDTLAVSSFAMQSLQEPQSPGDPDAGAVASGLMASSFSMNAAQATSFYTQLGRNLFEAPYAWLQRRYPAANPSAGHVCTVVARPSDRMTDSHTIWTREDFPAGTGSTNPFTLASGPTFTPWITTHFTLQHLETTAMIRTSSFYDGVPLTAVRPGQVALIGAEIVRIEQVLPDRVILARGCFDTVPAKHNAGSRLWFFEAMSGFDTRDFPWHTKPTKGGAAQVKMVPSVFGPELSLNSVPTDRINFKQRGDRPYPPGQVVAGGRPWFEGASTIAGQTTVITWAHRNRITQGAAAIDHTAGSQGAEPGQKYRLKMTVSIPPPEGSPAGTPPTVIIIRDNVVDGEQFDYTYEMALKDGFRAGRALGVCGTVSVGLTLFAIRDGFESWQGYTIMLRLPSYACAPGQTPGGGQWPYEPGNGNGDVDDGSDPADPTSPGADPDSPPGDPISPDYGDPDDPLDNGGGADNGDGPPEPPDPPDEWPDPIDPPPDTGEPDPNPELAGHWDTNWDRHWDAYAKDDIAGEG